MIGSLASLLGLCAVSVVLIFLIAWPSVRSKSEAEDGGSIYEERCWGRQKAALIFFYGGTIPNWRITLYDDHIVVASIRKATIKYSDIMQVEYRRQFISKGIHIWTRDGKEDFILFPQDADKILAILSEKGVRISK